MALPPNYIKRKLELTSWVKRKSILLLGPRQTGKSTLLRHEFPEARTIDLLESRLYYYRTLKGKRIHVVAQSAKTGAIAALKIFPWESLA